MKIKDFIVFEPINLSNVALVLIPIILLVTFYGKEVGKFMDNLASVKLNMLSGEITLASHPVVVPLEQVSSDFDETFEGRATMISMGKSTLYELEERMESIDGRIGVLRYPVNQEFGFYSDEEMLMYLSVASSKTKFLAFYDNEEFVGAIEIEKVISGIAGNQPEYTNFGEKLVNGEWRRFPYMIKANQVFTDKPTLKVLYQRLNTTGHSAIPLLEQGRLVGFLDYKSISDDLYKQATPVESI